MNFKEAVDVAKEFLAGLEGLASEAERLADFIVYFCQEGDETSLDSVVDAAGDQLLSFEALGLAAARYLEAGMTLPDGLEKWVLNVLRGRATRPKTPAIARAGWPGSSNERDLMIYDALKALHDRGLAPTRNPTSPKTSGCDAVAEAMNLMGYPRMTYGTAKKIYEAVGRKFRNGSNPRLGVDLSSRLRRATKL